jgi:hypothetical protein
VTGAAAAIRSAITVDETKERAGVDAWLASTGYPVESAAARALERAGFEVDLGRLYRDPDTRIRREIDVVARTRLMYDEEPRRVRLVVECKHLEKPWVILDPRSRGDVDRRSVVDGGERPSAEHVGRASG